MEDFYTHEFLRGKIEEIISPNIDTRRKSLIEMGIDEKLVLPLGTPLEYQEVDDFLFQLLQPYQDDELFEALLTGPYVSPGIGIDLSDQEFENFIENAKELSETIWLQGHGSFTTTDGKVINANEIMLQNKSEYSKTELILPSTRLEIVRLSPSFKILEKLLKDNTHLDKLHWREFEELVADLLHQEGYIVQLGPGRNDGGKDIIATKEIEGFGSLMSVWQAKKSKNNVGIDIIRELADTRNEQKANKGIIVTSSYLTKGALERVKRDKYILGKVDKDDLTKWINRVAYKRS
jgi:HJR/Mrr/RecB family endonuclease